MLGKHITKSAEETEKLGEEFSEKLIPGDVVLLKGDLGTGKTTFTKGLAQGLGITTRVISPTFVIAREHTTGSDKIQRLYHLDLYRLGGESEIKNIDLNEYTGDENAVVVIEWPEKGQNLLDRKVWDISFKTTNDNTHEIQITHKLTTDQIVEKLRVGKIGIFPTDTAYGIGCRMDDNSAVEKVFHLRNRPEEKALIVLVSSVEMCEQFVKVSNDVRDKLINNYWPGGVTIILPCKSDKVLPIVRAGGDTLAVRFPNHDELRMIIEKVGVPIVAPSANLSGEETPFSLDMVDKTLLSQVDFVVDGVCTIKGVSTIIDTTVSPWKKLREGVIKIYNEDIAHRHEG